MTKYYTPKLTEAQYFHVLDAMLCYGSEQDNDKSQLRLHERTEQALMKAQENWTSVEEY